MRGKKENILVSIIFAFFTVFSKAFRVRFTHSLDFVVKGKF